MAFLLPFLWPVFLTLVLCGALCLLSWLLIGRHKDLGNEQKFPRQLIMLGLTVASMLWVILALPISDSSRAQLVGILGLLLSGTIAFSSTSLLSNLMGGILLRTTKPFRVGDFVRVEEHFGRVTERGLFDTEIQTENREFIALPNAYLMSHPITTTHRLGALVSTTLSLGFDIPHTQAESLLSQAAESSGLKDPFVHVLELGNFAVTYRVSGILEDSKKLISARSNLCRSVLDTLHGAGLEIMSPTYMNQRPVPETSRVIPPLVGAPVRASAKDGEDVAFDKADAAEQAESERQVLVTTVEELETALKAAGADDKASLKDALSRAREALKALDEARAKASDEDEHARRPENGAGPEAG